MFERYTEKARRVIFFARYEASQYGLREIDTEHLLLAILREDSRVVRVLPAGASLSIRAQIDARSPVRSKGSASVDLPLSNASKRVLAYGSDEADRLNHRHIGTAHLFLGLLREKGFLAQQLLEPFGTNLEQLRTKIEVMGAHDEGEVHLSQPATTIWIHGSSVDFERVRVALKRSREHNWHWHKTSWKARDCVTERTSGRTSLDLSLAEHSTTFELVKGGWKKELFESLDAHGTAYTNGRDWVCLECHDKFWDRPDFIAGAYS